MKSEPDEFIRILRNEDITEIVAEIPDGHRHLRTRVTFADGTAITFQEATMAALVRAYVAVKTDPRCKRVLFRGQSLAERKEGYAEWQLLEEP